MANLLKELNVFLDQAALATYAGDGDEVPSQRLGYTEYEYREGLWLYRDSYSGHFQSWGQEIVWHNNLPFWTQAYGGGMEHKYAGDRDFSQQTVKFLKAALSQGDKSKKFQPRGPRSFTSGDWSYSAQWTGNIRKFEGSEAIMHQDRIVFTHNYFGGLFLFK